MHMRLQELGLSIGHPSRCSCWLLPPSSAREADSFGEVGRLGDR